MYGEFATTMVADSSCNESYRPDSEILLFWKHVRR